MKKSRSVVKNIRKSARRRQVNKIKKRNLRSAMKKLKKMKTKKQALKVYSEVQSLIDKSIQDGLLKRNTAARYKSHLIKYIEKMK